MGAARVTVHQRLADAVLLLGLVGALWGLVGALRGRVSPTLRTYLLLTEVAVVVQALVGIGLAIAGDRPHDGLHFFYGPAVLLSLPVAALIGRSGDERGEAWALTGGALAVFLFSIRAIGTGA